MNEFKIINDYLKKLVVKNKSSLNLNDDVFFDVSKKTVISLYFNLDYKLIELSN